MSKNSIREARRKARGARIVRERIVLGLIALFLVIIIGVGVYRMVTPQVIEVEVTPTPSPIPTLDLSSLGADTITTDTGLKYVDLAIGNTAGLASARGDSITVNYTGWLSTGVKFDSSEDHGRPLTFVLGTGQVIPGWDEGLVGMYAGGKRRLIIPPALGYGEVDFGSIPANSTLIFEVEVVAITRPE